MLNEAPRYLASQPERFPLPDLELLINADDYGRVKLSDPKHVHKRAHARSYDTPLITRAYRSVNAPLGPELAAIRFLERMGYDVHYATGFDLSGKHADNILKRWPVELPWSPTLVVR